MENPVPQRTAVFQDMSFFNRQGLLPLMKNCEYKPIVISDHGPLTLRLAFGLDYASKYGVSIIAYYQIKKVVEKLKNEIVFYLSFNDTPDTLRSTLREALTAYVCGHIISHSSAVNKQRRERKNRITDDINVIDQQYAINHSTDLHKRKLSLQTELNLIYSTETTKLLTQAKHKYYEHEEKAGRILAHQIKEQAASRTITEIRTDSGQTTIDPKEINNILKTFLH